MAPSPLRSSRSAVDSRVTLITAVPNPTSSIDLKAEHVSPSPSSSPFTSLRRSTRSTTSQTTATSTAPPQNFVPAVDLSSYAHIPATPSPRKKIKLEHPDTPSTPKKASTPKSVTKKPLPQVALAKPHPAPPKWEEQYRLIDRMRKGIVAPVDNMGCERPRTTEGLDEKTLRFHILISLMLSSQTKDPVTSQAVTNLHHTLPGGLTASSLATASVETIQECINKVGFWRRKTEYIQDAARLLLEQPGEASGDVPNTLEGLCALRGVGPKMAFLALQAAWNINAGIGVDVHVHRITNRLRWHKPPTQTPEQTRLNLESWLPSELHRPINPMLVGFGQVVCLPVGPRCDICLLGQRRLCPSRVSNVKSEGRKEVVYTFSAEDGELVKMDAEDGVKAEDGEPGVKVELHSGQSGVKVEIEYEEEVLPVDQKIEAEVGGGMDA
ncbi:DNA glycosylase [Naematelia encephala]|uniref:Endonuclease III homolog n=1 Tax=Naematelia encephala TaxID=71784 RepID=A0A1Y2ATZ0_9TREE|nr:DNA glycosylase [Naematelia encephala]